MYYFDKYIIQLLLTTIRARPKIFVWLQIQKKKNAKNYNYNNIIVPFTIQSYRTASCIKLSFFFIVFQAQEFR